MSKAKKLIIQASVELFNKHGFSNVSQHKVAEYISMSPGNITYHFKKKSDILEYIYFEYNDLVENHFVAFTESEMMLDDYKFLIENWFKENYCYRFLFSELENVLNISDKVLENYKSFVLKKERLFLEIYKMLISLKIVNNEDINNLNKTLTPVLHIVSTFHTTYLITTTGERLTKFSSNSIELFYSIFYPFLTETGKSEFKKTFG